MASDKTLVCRDCGASFTFTASEQDFYAQKGFTNEPSRCPDCRAARKASGGYGSGGGYGRSSDRAPREMHSVTCSQCGKPAEVPFVPSSDKPVYCSDCFEAHRGASRGSDRGGDRGGSSGGGRQRRW